MELQKNQSQNYGVFKPSLMFIGLFLGLFFGTAVQASKTDLAWPEEEFYKGMFHPEHREDQKSLQFLMKLGEKYPSALPLMPNRFLVKPAASNPALQTYIDNTYFELLSKSATARKLCQNMVGNSVENLEIGLGVSATAAKKLFPFCKSDQVGLLSEKSNFTKRRIFFVFGEGPRKADSWTSLVENGTFIFLDRNNRNQDYVLRALTHEMAIYSDGRLRWLKGLLEAQPLLLTDPVLKAAIFNSYVMITFSTIRALEVEDAVLREIAKAAPRATQAFSCTDKFYSLLSQTTEMLKIRNMGEDFVFTRWVVQNNPGPLAEAAVQKYSDLDVLLQKLTEVRFKTADGSTRSLCEELVRPVISAPFLVAGSGGPRPNVGNGFNTQEVSPEQREALKQEVYRGMVENVNAQFSMTRMSPAYKRQMFSLTVETQLEEIKTQKHDGVELQKYYEEMFAETPREGR
jgi:hypothetical protein